MIETISASYNSSIGGTLDELIIRPFQPEDERTVLQLNEASVQVLSPMNTARFYTLKKMASLLWVGEMDGEVTAFSMAFSDGADYDSVNYQWFFQRVKGFLYIDRLVVSEKARSSGIGQKFYKKIEKWACTQQLNWLAAEVDIQPPNTGSLKFHKKQDFIEVGRQLAGESGKIVSLQVKSIKG